MNDRINIKAVDLEKQKIIDSKEHFIEFHEKYIKFVVNFLAEEPVSEEDESLGWQSMITNLEVIALKKSISGIQKTYLQKCKRWKVSVLVQGFSDDIHCYFKFQSEAEAVYSKLVEYLL